MSPLFGSTNPHLRRSEGETCDKKTTTQPELEMENLIMMTDLPEIGPKNPSLDLSRIIRTNRKLFSLEMIKLKLRISRRGVPTVICMKAEAINSSALS